MPKFLIHIPSFSFAMEVTKADTQDFHESYGPFEDSQLIEMARILLREDDTEAIDAIHPLYDSCLIELKERSDLDAQTLREDARQVPTAGPTEQEGQVEGGPDLQRPEPREAGDREAQGAGEESSEGPPGDAPSAAPDRTAASAPPTTPEPEGRVE